MLFFAKQTVLDRLLPTPPCACTYIDLKNAKNSRQKKIEAQKNFDKAKQLESKLEAAMEDDDFDKCEVLQKQLNDLAPVRCDSV